MANRSSFPLRIVAHRGLGPWNLPENSREAIDAAWRNGIVWAECDVHASRDGVPVVIHDQTLDRTTDLRGRVAERTWAALSRARLRHGDSLGGELVASLSNIVESQPAGAGLFVEIKPDDDRALVERVLKLLAGANPAARFVVESFDERNLFHARQFNAPLELVWLIEDASLLKRAIESPWPGISVDHKLLDESLANALRARGKSIGVWTVNQPADLARAAQLGADVIISDDPVAASAFLSPFQSASIK